MCKLAAGFLNSLNASTLRQLNNFFVFPQLFEGMKAYRGADGKIRVFRPEMNMARMNASASRAGLPTFEGDEFVKCMSRLVTIDQEWVPHTEAASLYLRPTLIGIEPTLGVASSDSALLYTILSPVGGYFKPGAASMGVSLLADPRYTRAWPGGVGDRKMGSNYAPTIQIQKEASAQGLNQVLWLYGDDHQVTEAGTMNVFVLLVNEKGGEILTRLISWFFTNECLNFRTRANHPTAERSHPSWNHS